MCLCFFLDSQDFLCLHVQFASPTVIFIALVSFSCVTALVEAPGMLKRSVESRRECVLSRFSRVQLCDPEDCSPPGSSVHGILEA